MKLHVLTAVTRPENLDRIGQSLGDAITASEGFVDVCWHLRFDLEQWHVGGQKLKNDMLDEITDGWVWILDDDTKVHPQLFERLRDKLTVHPAVDALVVSQKRSDGGILLAARANVKVTLIDIGQAIMRRDLIGDERIPIDYSGDGMFLETVLAGADVIFVNDVLSLHNALR